MHPRLHAAERPDHPAVIMSGSGETLTYGELERRANRGAQLFRALGLNTGDTIALFMSNSLAYFEIAWAAQRAGLYFTPVPSRLTAGEADYMVRDCGARVLIASAHLKAQAEPLAAALGDAVVAYGVDGELTGFDDFRAARARFPETPIADEASGLPMFYSSGTTGRPKGVRYPPSAGPATAPQPYAEFIRPIFGFGPDTVYLSPAPLYHAAPLSYGCFVHRYGGTVVVMERFDAEAALAAIERFGVTHSQWAPTMFIRMLKLPEAVRNRYDLSSHRRAIHAAAPCPVAVKRGMIDWWGPIIHEYYAGTEGAGVTMIAAEEALRKPGSVGRAVIGTIHICDETGAELPTGEEGVIYFEGGGDFSYHQDPDKTARAKNPLHPRWATFGDIGKVDADGYLYLTDRRDFMIVSGGVNVYPQEVENLLIGHPKVGDVAVFGVPDEDLGEAVKAVIEPVDWADAGDELAAELMALCRAQLAPAKRPKSVDFDPALPRHDTGKLFKRLLRDRYWKGRETRIG